MQSSLRCAAILALLVGAIVAACGDPEADAEARRWGHHCLSGWDGNHDGFESRVRALLNDPGSMETHGTRTSQVNAGTGLHRITMDYSAKNAFGGRVRATATGLLDPDTCDVTVVDYGF